MTDHMSIAEDAQQQLLVHLQAYLRATAADTGSTTAEGGQDNHPQTDLLALFSEIAGLKNEIRLESRQFKTSLDNFKELSALLQANQQQLSDELKRNRDAQHQLQKASLRPLLSELLDLYDRLAVGEQALSQYADQRADDDHRTTLRAFAEAQSMSLRRLRELLAAHSVELLSITSGQTLDPHSMRAVEVVERDDLSQGQVIEVLRVGFRWNDEILRPAEVSVSKQPTRAPEVPKPSFWQRLLRRFIT